MKKELKDNQNITYTIIYLLMVFSLANVMSSVLAINLNIIGKFFITILIGLIVQLLVLIPTTLLPVLGTLVGTVLIYNVYNQEAVIRVLLWISQFYQNISNHFKGTEEILLKNSRALWIIFVVLLSIYTIIVLFKTKHNYLLLPVYLLFFVYYWYIYIDVAYIMMALFLMLYITLLGCDGYFTSLKDRVKERSNYSVKVYPYWFKTAIRYGIVIILIAAILPKGGAVVDWHWLESEIQERFPSLLDFRDDVLYSRSYGQADMFDFRLTGFQPHENQLGGPVKVNERLVMKVKAPYRLYLRGNVKNIYQNNHWEKDSTNERIYNTSTAIPPEFNFGSRITVEITYENLATNTVFSPYQLVKINNSNIKRMKLDKNYQVTLLGSKYKGEGYEVKANIPSGFVDFDEEEELTDYYEYLQLPIKLSDSVYKLGDNITKGATTPYEKAILIRDYLRENYKYTLEPSHTPPGKEFVEHFLFNEKEGYCTYFATAMAVLLRTQGIPSRYIEGYMLPQERVDGVYEVRQTNAHAWVEAYVGSGSWITFEATPAFQIPTFQDIDITREGLDYRDRRSIEDLEQIYEDGRSDVGWTDELINEGEDAYPESPSIPSIENSFSVAWDYISKALLIAIMAIILGIVPIRVIYVYKRNKKYYNDLRKLKGSSVVLYLYQNISQLLEQLNYGILNGETAFEYARRITNKIYNYEFDFRQLTGIYVKAKYSHIELSEEEIENIFDFFEFIEWKVRNRNGLFKYFYKKYIRGKLYHCYKVSDETIANL